jgi:PhoPQ-activated pathogenicity-related protein
MHALRFCLLALLAVTGPGFVPVARADLADYLKKPEKSYAWKIRNKTETPEGTVYHLHLVSQTWQKITWEHDLMIYLPGKVKPTGTMLLYNTGGKPNAANSLLALDLANKMQAPVAFLFGIPNQPLFDDKKEDALIAETFVRYLEERDESWPLLFPMVKSLVKAMDAIQEFGRQEWKTEVKDFVVTGGSKRGWTSWLTGASDPRVRAIAPLVIDTLNMQKQLPYQLLSYGAYSDMIKDYTLRKLVPAPDTPEGRKLWSMVDPWVYRGKLTMPKLIVNGTNDPYWTQDALNLYWDDLKGDKWVLYVPNAGHDLQQQVGGEKNRTRAINTLATFARCQALGKEFPRSSWKHTGDKDSFTLTVQCSPAPKAARLWVANSATRDFRKSTWQEQAVELESGKVVGKVKAPEKGFRVFLAECEYEENGLPYYLSTQLRIVEAAKRE